MATEEMMGLMGGMFVGGLMLVWLFFMALFVFLFVFWIMMLVDCVKRKFKNENDKIAWILVVAILNWLGAIVYYFAVKRKG